MISALELDDVSSTELIEAYMSDVSEKEARIRFPNFWQLLGDLISDAGVTGKSVGEKSGVSQQDISLWTNGFSIPSAKKFRALVAVLTEVGVSKPRLQELQQAYMTDLIAADARLSIKL